MDFAMAPQYVREEGLSAAAAKIPLSEHLMTALTGGTASDVPPCGAPAIPPWSVKLKPLQDGNNAVTRFEEERAMAAAKAAATSAAAAHAAVLSSIAAAKLPAAPEGSTVSAASLQPMLSKPICNTHQGVNTLAKNAAARCFDWGTLQPVMWRQALENMDKLCNHLAQSVAGQQTREEMGVAVFVAASYLGTANALLPSEVTADMGMPPGFSCAPPPSVLRAPQHAGPLQDPHHTAKIPLRLAQHIVNAASCMEPSSAGCFNAEGTPQGNAQSNGLEEPTVTLKLNLSYLLEIEPGRVVVVRKINRLGLQSPTILANHFARYGTVERVLVAHTKTKQAPFRPPTVTARWRPAGLGFVVMRLPQEACMILAEGSEHLIDGMSITVRQFECHQSLKKNDGEAEEDVP